MDESEGKLSHNKQVQLILAERFKSEIEEFGNNLANNKAILLDFNLVLPGFEIGKLLCDKPTEVIELFQKQIAKQITNSTRIRHEEINVRFDNYYDNTLNSINDLKSKYVGKFVNFEGVVKRRYTVRPIVKTMLFECKGCMRTHEVEQKTETLQEPGICKDCGGRSFRPLLDFAQYKDRQILVVQEPLEKTKGTEIPRTIELYADEDLVDCALPGQNVNITGILKVLKDDKKFKFYVDTNYLKNVGKTYDDIEISPEDEKEIKELSKNPELMYMMTHSIVPSIRGYINEKKAIVLHLFGGTEKTFADGGRKRSSINILLVGEPGIGKALSVDTLIPTPNGFTTMEDLEVGDMLFDERGNICNVINK
jgi:replicative DNA helicase Mcm